MSARMQRTKVRVTIECISPLHHGAFGEDTGNAVAFRRMPIASAPQRAGLPVLSGNALRGAVRRALMRELFEVVTLSRDSDVLTHKQWDKLYGALANGGHLTGSENTAKPDERRALREAVPALSLLGAALYSHMLPGMVSIGWCWPQCVETVDAGYCTNAERLKSADDLLTEISLVRHIDRDWQDPAASGVTPMPTTVEALIPGTVLQCEVESLARLTSLEWAAMGHGLNLVSMIGGKVGVGFGRLVIAHPIDTAEYIAWLADADRVAKAREVLIALAQRML